MVAVPERHSCDDERPRRRAGNANTGRKAWLDSAWFMFEGKKLDKDDI